MPLEQPAVAANVSQVPTQTMGTACAQAKVGHNIDLVVDQAIKTKNSSQSR
jgi:hypothetical protein